MLKLKILVMYKKNMKILILTALSSQVFAGAPTIVPGPLLNSSMFPVTCGDVKTRYKSSGCCDGTDSKPYIPILSDTCKNVYSVFDMEWNTTALGMTMGDFPMFSAMATQYGMPQNTLVFDMFRGNPSVGRLWTWFNDPDPGRRVGFRALVGSDKITWDQDQDANHAVWAEAFIPAENLMKPFTGVLPMEWKMNAIEVQHSCESMLYNLANGIGIAANFAFYSIMVKKMDGKIFTPVNDCSTLLPSTDAMGVVTQVQTSLTDALAIISGVLGDKVTMTKLKTAEPIHPLVC